MRAEDEELLQIATSLSEELARLRFSPPVHHVYNPLLYAREAYAAYVTRFGGAPKEAVLLGMNPGPWGMAQTGVPFGEIGLVRDWMGIETPIGQPADEHPRRPVTGFACTRSEVSGRRLWGWARERFGTPEAFFRRFFVANYCPLQFLADTGRNLTPDKLRATERLPLLELCDEALRQTIAHLEPRWVIGVGAFAERRAQEALDSLDVRIGRILHPSPASPAANRGWAERADAQLLELGITSPA